MGPSSSSKGMATIGLAHYMFLFVTAKHFNSDDGPLLVRKYFFPLPFLSFNLFQAGVVLDKNQGFLVKHTSVRVLHTELESYKNHC
jgi:hypothetical protein